MDKPSPASQVCMSRESHNMRKKILHKKKTIKKIKIKNWVQECTSRRGSSIIELVQNLTQLRWSLEIMKILRLQEEKESWAQFTKKYTWGYKKINK